MTTGKRLQFPPRAPITSDVATTCPHCFTSGDGVTGPAAPCEGDLMLCWRCREPAIFTAEASLRKPTDEERARIEADPVFRRAIAVGKDADSPFEAAERLAATVREDVGAPSRSVEKENDMTKEVHEIELNITGNATETIEKMAKDLGAIAAATPSYAEMLRLVEAVGGETLAIRKKHEVSMSGSATVTAIRFEAVALGLLSVEARGNGETPELAVIQLAAACRDRLRKKLSEVRSILGEEH